MSDFFFGTRRDPMRGPWDDESAGGGLAPALDVIASPESVDIRVDLPGVNPASVHILFRAGTLVIAGEKRAPEPCAPKDALFHLAERGFGRFSRTVHIDLAIDAGRARATFDRGELRISLPRIRERRGRDMLIPIERVVAAS